MPKAKKPVEKTEVEKLQEEIKTLKADKEVTVKPVGEPSINEFLKLQEEAQEQLKAEDPLAPDSNLRRSLDTTFNLDSGFVENDPKWSSHKFGWYTSRYVPKKLQIGWVLHELDLNDKMNSFMFNEDASPNEVSKGEESVCWRPAGGGEKQYLMRIPLERWNQIQQIHNDDAREIVEATGKRGGDVEEEALKREFGTSGGGMKVTQGGLNQIASS